MPLPDGFSNRRRCPGRPRWGTIITLRSFHCHSGYPCRWASLSLVAQILSPFSLSSISSLYRLLAAVHFHCGCESNLFFAPRMFNVQHQHRSSSAWELDSSLCTFSSLFQPSYSTLYPAMHTTSLMTPRIQPTTVLAFQQRTRISIIDLYPSSSSPHYLFVYSFPFLYNRWYSGA